jgi:Uma2 family endonuclease
MTVVESDTRNSLSLDLSTLKLNDEQFYQLCVANPEHPLELTRAGVLVVMPPVDRQVEIYRLGQEVEILQSPETVSGENVLPGFVLDLNSIW